MKAYVDPDLCIACGLCVSSCPEVYDWDDDGKAVAKDEAIPQELEGSAEEAADGCPTDAIKTE